MSDDDLQVSLAVLFRKAGAPATPDKLVQTASLGLGWCKPSEAWNLVARGLDAGLLRRTPDARIALEFNPQEVTVPLGYEPPAALFEDAPGLPPSEAEDPPEDPSDLFEQVLARLMEQGRSRQEAVAAVNAAHDAMGGLVTLEVAGIVALAENGLETGDLLADVKAGLGAD